jgi:hypothetical protein
MRQDHEARQRRQTGRAGAGEVGRFGAGQFGVPAARIVQTEYLFAATRDSHLVSSPSFTALSCGVHPSSHDVRRAKPAGYLAQ